VTRAKWVSKAEYDARRAAGVCLRCGASGHMIGDCPYQRAKRPEPRVAQVSKRVGKKVEMAALLEDTDVEEDSEVSEN
jgi:hypothetical protein